MAATERVAAVLLPIIQDENECSILFTKRLRDLNHHGGEVSFPGGIKENSDENLAQTALRETHEEIGIDPAEVQMLGALDDQLSKWGHRVTPYVGLIHKPKLKPQVTEVDRIYKIPVSYLMQKDVYYSETWIKDAMRRDVHFYRYQNDIIWGLTARILYGFLEYMSSSKA